MAQPLLALGDSGGVMNRYDYLPTWVKWVHQVACIAPAIVAGIVTNSWKTGLFTLVWGFVLGYLIQQFGGLLIRRASLQADGEVDMGRFNDRFIWLFMLAGPVAGVIAADLNVSH